MSHFSRRCLRVFAFGCFFVRVVVFHPHALSLVIACAVWCSAGKLFSLIFCRYPFSVAVHNAALFTALRNVLHLVAFLCVLWCFVHTLYRFLSLAPFGVVQKSCFY
mgnify:FL=1